MDDAPRLAPSPPPLYLVLLCEGGRCAPLLSFDDAPLAEAEAAAALAGLAARLRAGGAVGRVLLVDGQTRRRVATRRVWP